MILGEVVHKGDDRTTALDESPAKVHIGDVRELVVRDVQQLGQLLTVGTAPWTPSSAAVPGQGHSSGER